MAFSPCPMPLIINGTVRIYLHLTEKGECLSVGRIERQHLLVDCRADGSFWFS
jgi:hypothetical protein